MRNPFVETSSAGSFAAKIVTVRQYLGYSSITISSRRVIELVARATFFTG